MSHPTSDRHLFFKNDCHDIWKSIYVFLASCVVKPQFQFWSRHFSVLLFYTISLSMFYNTGLIQYNTNNNIIINIFNKWWITKFTYVKGLITKKKLSSGWTSYEYMINTNKRYCTTINNTFNIEICKKNKNRIWSKGVLIAKERSLPKKL